MAKVIKAFIDKTNGQPYNVGYEYEGSRAEELAEAGYVIGVSKSAKKATAKKKATTKKEY